MSAHTPAPWTVGKGAGWYVGRPNSRCAHVVGVCNRTSLVDGDCETEAKANAYLIAASPELLAALKALVDPDLTYSGASIIIPTETHGDAIRLVREARAAIALATPAEGERTR